MAVLGMDITRTEASICLKTTKYKPSYSPTTALFTHPRKMTTCVHTKIYRHAFVPVVFIVA